MKIPQWISVTVLIGILVTVFLILPFCGKAGAMDVPYGVPGALSQEDARVVLQKAAQDRFAPQSDEEPDEWFERQKGMGDKFYKQQLKETEPAKPCPWKIKSVPVGEAEEWSKKNPEWEPFAIYLDHITDGKIYRRAWFKKRVCP